MDGPLSGSTHIIISVQQPGYYINKLWLDTQYTFQILSLGPYLFRAPNGELVKIAKLSNSICRKLQIFTNLVIDPKSSIVIIRQQK